MASLLWSLLSAITCQRRRSNAADGGSSGKEAGQHDSPSTAEAPPGAAATGAAAAALEGTAEELKAVANELFGRRDVEGAVMYWAEARRRAEQQQGCQDLIRSLDANLALGHLRLQAWDAALSYAESALAVPGPPDVKVLHRRVQALAGLRRWDDAERALQEFEATGGAKSISEQMRADWQRTAERTRRARADRVASAWGTSEAESKDASSGNRSSEWPEDEGWFAPTLSWTCAFDLRQDGFSWQEDDLNDEVWTPDGVRGRKADHFSMALPMTVMSAAALARLAPTPEVTIHVLQGRYAPMVQDWGIFLMRCPNVRTLHVVYVNLFGGGVEEGTDPLRPPRGCLTKPVEEARVDDRVALVARFTGSYSEFLRAAAAAPDLHYPWLALLADVPLACGGAAVEDRLALCLDALVSLAVRKVPVAVTLPAQAKERILRAPAQRSMAALRLLGAQQLVAWQWNRFTVTSSMFTNSKRDRSGGQGGTYIGAYAILGVLTLVDRPALRKKPHDILEALKTKHVPEEADDDNGIDNEDDDECDFKGDLQGQDAAVRRMVESEDFQKQITAFRRKMQKEGRPSGDQLTREEQHRQGLEFARWIATADRSEWDDDEEPKIEEVDDENGSK